MCTTYLNISLSCKYTGKNLILCVYLALGLSISVRTEISSLLILFKLYVYLSVHSQPSPVLLDVFA